MITLIKSIVISLLTLNLAFAAAPTVKAKEVINSQIFKIDPRYDFIYGEKNAPVEVIEYFSLTCPHCENFHSNIFPQIKKEYIDTGKVKWVARSYAIDNSSKQGTMLLYCAINDNYEKFLSILLNKQSSWAYQQDPTPVLRNIATLGGVSLDKFNECLSNKKFMANMNKVAEDSRKILKISGTPSFYVNQEKASLYTYNSFKELFDKLLAPYAKN